MARSYLGTSSAGEIVVMHLIQSWSDYSLLITSDFASILNGFLEYSERVFLISPVRSRNFVGYLYARIVLWSCPGIFEHSLIALDGPTMSNIWKCVFPTCQGHKRGSACGNWGTAMKTDSDVKNHSSIVPAVAT
jgi:hypothetical protein